MLATRPVMQFGAPLSAFCAFYCLSTPECKSYNFCNSQTCLLNSVDVLEFEWSQSLIAVNSCKYVGMKRKSRPQCFEGTVEKNITDDNDPGACRINEKRTDANWIPHQKNYTYRNETLPNYFDCTGNSAAHGGLQNCENGQLLIPEIEQLYFSTEPKNFFEAAQFCNDSFGGRIFDDILEEKFQLSYVWRELNRSCMGSISREVFMTGVNDLKTEGEWRDAQNQLVSDQVNWSKMGPILEPNGNTMENVAAVYCVEPDRRICPFIDVTESRKECYACLFKADFVL